MDLTAYAKITLWVKDKNNGLSELVVIYQYSSYSQPKNLGLFMMKGQFLSIIIPAYNEEATVGKAIERVLSIDIDKEILAVDDGSTDDTRKILDKLSHLYPNVVMVFYHNTNMGKGAAIRTAIPYIRGDAVIIQDADLENDPNDIPKVVRPILDGEAEVVFGSRVLGNGPFLSIYYLGGRFLSFVTNILYGTHITDEPTCYKAFRSEILKGMELHCTGFEFCPEVTAKVAKAGYEIKEVPISYNPRSSKEGKKLRWKDGFAALYTLLKYRFLK